MKYLVPLILLFITAPSYAVDFNDYCQHDFGEEDCSAEFQAAVQDAGYLNEPIFFYGDEKFLIRSVEVIDSSLSSVKLVGVRVSEVLPTIQTEGINLTIEGRLEISGINFIGYQSYEPTSLNKGYLLKLVSGHQPQSAMVLSGNEFRDGSDDLIAIWDSSHVSVTNNLFQRAGLADNLEVELVPGDERPIGSGILAKDLREATFADNEFFEMKKIGIYFDSQLDFSESIQFVNNYFDLKHFEVPTKRYGYQGAVGIYLNQTARFRDIEILGNIFLGTINGVRINGKDIRVADNLFNPDTYCVNNRGGDASALEDTGIAIKGHYLENVTIEDNCIEQHALGIALVSWGEISNIDIISNRIVSGEYGISAEENSQGTYGSVLIFNNQFYALSHNSIALRSRSISERNKIIQNTIIQDPYWDRTGRKTSAPVIVGSRQNRLLIENNYMIATPTSINWNLVSLSAVTNSVVKRNYLRPGQAGVADDFGGLLLRAGSNENEIYDNTFVGFDPAIFEFDSSSNSIYSNNYN